MKLIETAKLRPDSLTDKDTERLFVYNGLDCCLTLEIFDAISPQLDNITNNTYRFSMDLMGPCLEMNMRGVLIDPKARDEAVALYRKDYEHIVGNLNTILIDGLDSPISNWNSHQQLKHLLYDVMGIPPVKKRNSKGEFAPTVDRDALEKIYDSYFVTRPIISHILAAKDIGKKISVLTTEIDDDGRIRTSFNIGGTDTGRLSSSLSDFGTGCVLPSAEVLTRNGWVKISEANEANEIAQWDKGTITFVPWKKHKETSSEMIIVKSEQIQSTLTKGHRVLFWDAHNKKPRVEHAQNVSKKHQVYIPLGGTLEGGLIAYPAFLSMLMADFSKEGSGWRGSFTKQRKIDRFLSLAKEFNFPFNEQKAPKGYRRFYIPGLLNYPKHWGEWILNLSPMTASVLLEEARYWDSYDRGSGFIFFTASEEQAGWFATLAHIAGRSATIRRVEQNEGSYSDTVMWWVNVKSRDYVQILKKYWSVLEYSGDVYCPQVPSGFWLVRENKFISVTGNTNLQNVEERLRKVFISDRGMKFAYIDLEQAESRAVGAIIWNSFHDGAYLDACESQDLHTYVARLAFPELPWTGDIKRDKEIAERPFYRQHSYRHVSKVLSHGSNYMGTPPTMQKHTKIDKHVIEEFQSRYFTAFPGIPRWHASVERTLRDEGKMINLMGRKRHFFGRRNDATTHRAAVAYDPQGSVANILNQGMIKLWRARLSQLLLQVHDATLTQHDEAKENEIVPQELELIKVPVELAYGRTLIIPSEASVGWNWAKAGPDNPDGLIKFRGNDTRKRTRVFV